MFIKYPAVAILIFVIFGILIGDNVHIDSGWMLLAGLLTSLSAMLLYYKSRRIWAGIMILLGLTFFSAYNFSYRFYSLPPRHISHFSDNNQYYTIYGEVIDWPDLRQNETILKIRVDSLAFEAEKTRVSGKILVNINAETTLFGYGDRIYFRSRIYSIKGGKGISDFDYKRYLNLKGIFGAAYLTHPYFVHINHSSRGNLYRLIDIVRNYIRETFRDSLKPSSAAIATGFLIGETRDIPSDVYELFRDTGTLHVLAVSGSNVGLVIVVFAFFLKSSRLTDKWRMIVTIGVIVIFSFVAYNQPSVVRASLMAGLVVLGWYLQRYRDLNNIVAAAAVIILVFDPGQFFDVGFQLSFATAWGLIFLTPFVISKIRMTPLATWKRYLLFLLLTCLIAQLVSIPLTAYYFNRVPLMSVFSNIIVVPLISILVIGELILLLAALVHPLLGQFFGSLLSPLFDLNLFILRIFSPENYNLIFHCNPGLAETIIYLAVLVLGFVAIKHKPVRKIIIYSVLIIANAAILISFLNGSDEEKISIYPVASGFVVFSRIDHPRLILIDFDDRDYSPAEKIITPYLRLNHIDAPELIALSDNYNTILETYRVHLADSSGSCLFPVSSKNLLLDIIKTYNLDMDSDRIQFYGENEIPDSASKSTRNIRLDRGIIVYSFDSSRVCIVNNDYNLSGLYDCLRGDQRRVTLIKPYLAVKDINSLKNDSSKFIQNFICYKISPKAKKILQELPLERKKTIKVYQLSQIGALELIRSAGRIKPHF